MACSSIKSALKANNILKIDILDAYPIDSLVSRIDNYQKKSPVQGLIVGLGLLTKEWWDKRLSQITLEYKNVIHPSAIIDQQRT